MNAKNLRKIRNECYKKLLKGAKICIRKKYFYIFENEELINSLSFSLSMYNKIGRYETLQLEVSIDGKGIVISSLQSKKGKENLQKLFYLIQTYKKLSTTIEVIEKEKEIKEKIRNIKFKESSRKND